MSTEDLKAKLLAVHEARLEYARRHQARKDRENKFQAENLGVFVDELAAEQALVAVVTEVREAAVAAYQADPKREKNLCPGLTIKVMSEYDFMAEAALGWAKTTGLCLLLDAKGFKKVCQTDSLRPAFVTVREVPQAQISTDLGKVVEAEVEP